MLRQIAIFLLVPILIIPGIIPDEFSSNVLSFAPAQISSDNNFDPDRSVADFARMLVVQIILVISFLLSSFYFIPSQEPLVRSLRSRAPPLSRYSYFNPEICTLLRRLVLEFSGEAGG